MVTYIKRSDIKMLMRRPGVKGGVLMSRPNEGRNLDAFTKLESITYSISIDNLPESMTNSWLWQIFSHEGEVVDVFISRK